MARTLGAWAFIIGLIIAAVVAILWAKTVPAWSIYVLVALGLIVGFLNITEKEVMPFLLSAIAFLITFQSLSAIVVKLPLGGMLDSFFKMISVFIAAATALVAFKELFAVSKR